MIDKSEIYVLYGSQTGNSEHIAKDFHSKLIDEGIPAVCHPLNAMKKVDLKATAKVLVVICSTTGNGDCPENADQWWRSVKLRSAAKDMFQDLPFAVLGLGDTNYDKFCHMGKSIDKRFGELGGNRILDLFCADEATGLEETVEKWKMTVLVTIKNLLSVSRQSHNIDHDHHLNHLNQDSTLQTPLQNEIVGTSNIPMDETKEIESHQTNDSNNSNSDESSERNVQTSMEVMIQSSMPIGIFDYKTITDWLDITDKIVTSPSSTQLPRSKPMSSIIKFPWNETLDTPPSHKNSIHASSASRIHEYSAENPFQASIISASYLTQINHSHSHEWEEIRKVIKVELSLDGSNIEYNPGDSIGVCCPNPPFHVNLVFQRLQQYYTEPTISLDSIVHDCTIGSNLTIEELLTYRYDLTGPPKKAAVLSLAKCCKDSNQGIFLEWLCSKSEVGKLLWTHFVEDQRIGIAELLELVPSCCPSLDILISCLTPLPPRFYSIASSPLIHSKSVVFAFSVVRYLCGVQNLNGKESPRLKRYGVCTTYLENLLKPWLSKQSKESIDMTKSSLSIRIFHKSTIGFHLPGSSAHPLILIGPGTGVSPFIGFLEHIEHHGQERAKSGDDISTGVWRGGYEVENLPCESGYVGQYIQSVARGAVYLFFGCRGPSDYLFKDYLQEKEKDGTLTVLDVAMSRIGPEKVYVTHKLLSRGAEICDLILNHGAYIYICGDGNDMAKSVQATIKKIFVEYGHLSEDAAHDTLEDLRHRRRYLLDIWS